jgi:hypothetical protein
VRRASIARLVAAIGVTLTLGACSSLQASPSSTTVVHGSSVPRPASSTTRVSSPSAASSTTAPRSTSATTATTRTSGTGYPVDANQTSQIADELAQLQSLLGDTDTDFAAGKKES